MRRWSFQPPRTVRGRLLALMAIVLTPLVAVGAYGVVDDHRDRRDAEVAASAELARSVAGRFEAFVQDVLRTEYAVAASFAHHGHTPAEIREELLLLAPELPAVADMSWLDPRAVVLASTEPALVGKSLYARDYFQEILAGADRSVSRLVASLADGRPVFVVARAFRGEGGKLAGVVTAAVDATKLGPLLPVRSGGGRTSIVDSAGVLVAIQPPPADLSWEVRERTRDHAWFREALRGADAVGTFRSPVTGELRVGALVPIERLGWAAHASRPLEEAMAPASRLAVLQGAAVLAVALAALGAGLLFARTVERPLHALEAHAARLGGGGAAPLPTAGPVEVTRVARALEQMAAALAERRADLEAANRRLAAGEARSRELAARAAQVASVAEARSAELEAVMKALPIGLVIVDVPGGAVRVNDSAREILGLARGEAAPPAPGLAALRAGLEVFAADGSLLSPGEEPPARALRGGAVRGEVLRIAAKGGARPPVWVAVSAAPIREGSGAIVGAVTTFEDITELRRLEEERETLMQTVSHDLRTPLHVIVGHAELLRRRADDEARRRAEAILSSAGRMTRLIGDLVDAARFEAGHVALHLEPVDLAEFLAAWRDRMAPALDVARVKLTFPEAVPVVLADAARLDQILANLVTNALKYSVAESEVRVDLQIAPEALRLSVADRGPGISADELPRLFQRYYRTKSSVRAEGLGLGLFITRRLVDAHGWRIEVASTMGAGSVFTVVVPVHAAAGSASRSTAA
jgi:signal transduction histidine kinase